MNDFIVLVLAFSRWLHSLKVQLGHDLLLPPADTPPAC